MRMMIFAGVAALAVSGAQAQACDLARQVESLIEKTADPAAKVSFIGPLDTTANDNPLDVAYAATFQTGTYYAVILAQGDNCAVLDGAALPLDNPVQWQTARKNIRAAAGID